MAGGSISIRHLSRQTASLGLGASSNASPNSPSKQFHLWTSDTIRQPSNTRLKLSARGRHSCRKTQGKPSVLFVAPAGRSLSAIRYTAAPTMTKALECSGARATCSSPTAVCPIGAHHYPAVGSLSVREAGFLPRVEHGRRCLTRASSCRRTALAEFRLCPIVHRAHL